MEYADAYDDDDDDDIMDVATPTTTDSSSSSSSATAAVEGMDGAEKDAAAVAAVDNEGEPTTTAVDNEGEPTNTEEPSNDNNNDDEFADALPTLVLSSVITDNMKQVLTQQLGYRRADLKGLRPDIASVLVAKQVARPMEGVPAHWYDDDHFDATTTTTTTTTSVRPWKRKRFLVSLVACVLGLAAGSRRMDLEDVMMMPSFLSWFFAASPQPRQPSSQSSSSSSSSTASAVSAAATAAATPEDDPYQDLFSAAVTDSSTPTTTTTTATTTDTTTTTTTPSASQSQQEQPPPQHEHSVRPGENYPTEPMDETWLDKAITAVERRLKRLLGGR